MLAGAGVLLLLAIPVLCLRLGFSDEGNYPAEHHHPPGLRPRWPRASAPASTARCSLVAELPAGHDAGAARRRSPPRLNADPGVAFASPAGPNDPADPTAVLWRIIPTTVAAGRGDRPTWSTGSATTSCPAAERRHRRCGQRHRQRRRPGRLLRATSPRACRCFFGAVLALSFLLLMVGVPLAARAAQGRDHEPALDRRRLRRASSPSSSGAGSSDLIGVDGGARSSRSSR